MLDTIFARRAMPLTPSQYGYMRLFLITSAQVPAPPYAGALPPSAEQALLLLSLTCQAGLEPAELAGMRVNALLGANGEPSSHVHVRAETTKHRLGRKVAMHPDVRRDVLAFCKEHPGEEWVAFVAGRGTAPNKRQMSGHGLGQWLRSAIRNAGVQGDGPRAGTRMPLNAVRCG